MFWADKVADEIAARFKDASSDDPIVIRDEKTASGRVHVGSLRGVAIHGVVADVLTARGVPNVYKYEINEFDPMDSIPAYVDESAYQEHFGKPLHTIPSPEGGGSFANLYGNEFKEVILQAGFTPEFYSGYELYTSGAMNDVIRTALERADDIRRIYREVSGSRKQEGWLPISVVCEECGKVLTTVASDFDGKTVAYTCVAIPGPAGAVGCGHEGRVSPFDGNAKFPWKVDWAAKWKALGVKVEGAGKDHSTKGGARDVANHISLEVFEYEPPYDIPYEFFLVGGKKMSSSKGLGSSAADVSLMVPTHIFRLVLLGTRPMRAINLDPDGDTIPTWFDWYDKIAEKYWDRSGDDDARLFELVHGGNAPEKLYLARFSSVAFLVQMEYASLEEEIAKIKGEMLTEAEREDLAERARYARQWLGQYAPEKYRFELQMHAVPAGAEALTSQQKEGLRKVLEYVESNQQLDGQKVHTALHEMRKEMGVDAKEFFSALYIVTLGKDSGPKAGWFLSVLDRDFLVRRLKEVTEQA